MNMRIQQYVGMPSADIFINLNHENPTKLADAIHM